jgi:hypothetical protein
LILNATQARRMAFCLILLFLIFGSCGLSLTQSDLASKMVGVDDADFELW